MKPLTSDYQLNVEHDGTSGTVQLSQGDVGPITVKVEQLGRIAGRSQQAQREYQNNQQQSGGEG